MRFIKKHLSLWRIVLIIGAAAIAIGVAARVSPSSIAVVKKQPDYRDRQTTAGNEAAYAKHSKDRRAHVRPGFVRPQDDDYYDRRREYWDRRIERRLDRREEYLDDQTGDDKDDADAKDNKDKKDSADKDDGDDEDDSTDREIERRREYWRKRLDKDW